MLSLNRVCLLGHIGGDVQPGTTTSGKAVANMTVATSKIFTTNDGVRSERTDWHRVVAWGRLAEVAQAQLKKGSLAYIEGELTHREWVDKKGQKQKTAEVVASKIMAGTDAPVRADLAHPQGGRHARAPARERAATDELGYGRDIYENGDVPF